MTYDLHLRPRENPDASLRAYAHDDTELPPFNPGPIDARREAWKRRLRDALRAHEPQFKQFAFDWSEIARAASISEEEARVRYRHIELNLPDDDPTGILVTICDYDVFITVPYWHQRAAAIAVFARVARICERLEDVGDLETHDPQLDRVVKLNVELNESLEEYIRVVACLPQIIGSRTPAPKPWWRFW